MKRYKSKEEFYRHEIAKYGSFTKRCGGKIYHVDIHPGEHLKVISLLPGLRHLQSIKISPYCRLTLSAAKTIGSLVHLRSLSIETDYITPNMFELIVSAPSLSSLSCNIPWNSPGDAIDYVNIISRVTILKELSLSGSLVGDAHILRLGSLTNLRSLSLQATRLQGKSLGILESYSQLEELDLSTTLFNQASNLSAIQYPGNLRCLKVNHTFLRGADLQIIARFRNLEYLDISRLDVRSKDLLFLAQIEKLRELHLNFTNVDVEVADILKRLPNLTLVSLVNTQIERNEFDSLREKLPLWEL